MGTRVVNIAHTAGGVVKWTVDRDMVLIGWAATTAGCLSRDPAITMAGITAGTVASPNENIITAHNASTIRSILNIPVERNQALYSSVTGAGSTQLYFEDPIDLDQLK
jgi:hypothetical protein